MAAIAQSNSRRGAACCARGRNTFDALATTEILAVWHTERGARPKASAPFIINKSPAARVRIPPQDTFRALRKVFRLEMTPILCFVGVTGGFN